MKMKKAYLYTCLSLVVLLGIYAMAIEPQMLQVNHIYLDGCNFGDGLTGKTAVQITDLHMNRIGKREKRVLDIVDEIQPDFIFFTGDYVKWKGDYEKALDFLSLFKAKIGSYAVMGDYDYSNSRKSCLFCHQQNSGTPTTRHSVQFLRNTYEELALNGGRILIGGMEKDEDEGLLSVTSPSIILSHSPLLFDELENSSNILMLSGDTHGGQVALSAWLWRMIGYEKAAKYSHGLYREGQKMMYVSKGIGTSHIPIRLFRPPEVVVLHF